LDGQRRSIQNKPAHTLNVNKPAVKSRRHSEERIQGGAERRVFKSLAGEIAVTRATPPGPARDGRRGGRASLCSIFCRVKFRNKSLRPAGRLSVVYAPSSRRSTSTDRLWMAASNPRAISISLSPQASRPANHAGERWWRTAFGSRCPTRPWAREKSGARSK